MDARNATGQTRRTSTRHVHCRTGPPNRSPRDPCLRSWSSGLTRRKVVSHLDRTKVTSRESVGSVGALRPFGRRSRWTPERQMLPAGRCSVAVAGGMGWGMLGCNFPTGVAVVARRDAFDEAYGRGVPRAVRRPARSATPRLRDLPLDDGARCRDPWPRSCCRRSRRLSVGRS